MFLTAVDNVMEWATLEFLSDIVDQLVLVDKASRETARNLAYAF